MKLEGGGTSVLCLGGVGLQPPTWWGFYSVSGLIRVLLAKTVATSCNVIVCEKSLFLLCRKKKKAFYFEKNKKRNHIVGKK